VKPNSDLLMVGTVALVPPTLSFAICLVVMPYSVTSFQEIPSDPNCFQLLLSVNQQKELRKIQSNAKPKILAVLNPDQQEQMNAKLSQGLLLWQGLVILDLSEVQQSEIQCIIKSQRLAIFKQLTPDQRRHLGRSLPKQLLQ
jgi:hypothetical protein